MPPRAKHIQLFPLNADTRSLHGTATEANNDPRCIWIPNQVFISELQISDITPGTKRLFFVDLRAVHDSAPRYRMYRGAFKNLLLAKTIIKGRVSGTWTFEVHEATSRNPRYGICLHPDDLVAGFLDK